MIKAYEEMKEIDVKPYCDFREAKDDNNKPILVPYLNWAKCIDLLHENGAQVVYFEPVAQPNGSSLIYTDRNYEDGKGNTNSVYETRIRIIIDDDEWEAQGPVMNGSNPVKDNSMSQQRLWNAQTRLFVKAVAIRTGLGFELWSKAEEAEAREQKEADVYHDIRRVKERVTETVTALQKHGLSLAGIAEKLNKTEAELKTYLQYYDILFAVENNLEYIRKSL